MQFSCIDKIKLFIGGNYYPWNVAFVGSSRLFDYINEDEPLFFEYLNDHN